MKHSITYLLMCVCLTTYSCKQQPCSYVQGFAPGHHLVSLEALQNQKLFIDTLKAHPELIVEEVINNPYESGIRGFQVYRGLRVFTSSYQLHSGKIHPGIYWVSNFQKTYPVNLSPVISFDRAVKLAQQTGNFRECPKGELGIFDINISSGNSIPDYRLVWCFEDGAAELILDANTGEALRMFDGVYI